MKINFTALCNVSESELRGNERASRLLDLPEVGSIGNVSERLAVVGGGPSVVDYVDEIRSFPGEVWAINGAFHWCLSKGIDATFYTTDAKEVVSCMAQGATRAVLSYRCHPHTFAACDGRIEIYSGEHLGPSSATAAALVAIQRGHKRVTFYGCNSDYSDAAGAPNPSPLQHEGKMLVRANGQEFLTNPGLIMQAELLSEIIREAPHVFDERGGGLLSALVSDPEWFAVAASQSIHDALKVA